MDTLSEQYFLDYCKARGYEVKRITPEDKAGRFPDYETTPAGSVIVEIKNHFQRWMTHSPPRWKKREKQALIVLSESVFAGQSLIQQNASPL